VRFNVTSRVEEDFLIIGLGGSLTLGPSLSTLRDTARQMLNTHKVLGVILDVSGVAVTDSSGLGELTVVYSLTANRRCALRLVGVSPSLHKMLEMTRLDELLPSSADVAAAKADIKRKK
jgi:anti-anti-sigma factor